jgi:outer membrane protein TolC
MILSLPLIAALSSGPSDAVQRPPRATRLSRSEAIDEAVAANPSILASREQVEEARARVTEAVSFPDPSFAATLTEERSLFRPRTATSKDIGLGLTVPFPDKFRLRGNVARGDLAAAEFSLQQLRQQIASQTAMAYDALLVALKHRDDLLESKKLAEDFLKRTELRYEAGNAARFDVIKAKVDLAQAENGLIANERSIAVARAGLNRLLGRTTSAPTEAADVLDIPSPLPPLEPLEKLAESSRPELAGLAAQREGAHSATTLAKEFWFPDVNLTLSRNFTTGDPAAYSTGVSIALPMLFFWQHEKGEVAEARHHEQELAATYSDLLTQVQLDVATTYATASTALRQAVYIRDELLLEAREAYRIASTSYGLGGASALDLLDAKRTLLDAESQYANALGSANDARADLERAVGAPLPTEPSGVPHD